MSENTPTVVVPPLPPLLKAGPDTVALRQPSGIQTVTTDDLITRADPYVTLTDDGKATIKENISDVLNPLEIAHVRLLVSSHNALPAEFRGQPQTSAAEVKPANSALTFAGCTPSPTAKAYWWGFRIFLDHCTCNYIAFAVAGGGAAYTTLVTMFASTSVAAAIGGPYVALAVGIIVTMGAWIALDDANCGGNGCNYNQSWTVQGWITSVC